MLANNTIEKNPNLSTQFVARGVVVVFIVGAALATIGAAGLGGIWAASLVLGVLLALAALRED